MATRDWRDTAEMKAVVEAVEECVQKAEGKGDRAVATKPLAAFVSDELDNQPIPIAAKKLIVDEAITMMEEFYAHLPSKRKRYKAEPVVRLRALRKRLGKIKGNKDFHREMIGAFREVRDAHTYYALPLADRKSVAFLPFMVDAWYDSDSPRAKPHFVVRHAKLPTNGPGSFGNGVEITDWNGLKMEDAVRQLGATQPGPNAVAQDAWGLLSMTVRLLGYSLPPGGNSVTVRYLSGDGEDREEHEVIVPWTVCTGTGYAVEFGKNYLGTGCSVGLRTPLAEIHEARKVFWDRGSLPGAGYPYPDVFQVEAPLEDAELPEGKRYGYLRIRKFRTGGAGFPAYPEDFVNGLKKVLERIVEEKSARDGLILDLRGNPGGSIRAAERCLQLFTNQTIEPARFHWFRTPLLQKLGEEVAQNPVGLAGAKLRLWLDDIVSPKKPGSQYTEGQPLTDPSDANDTGQVYDGQVVLLVDALTYSAADIFAAGFQDHGIGEIVGMNRSTGGGGANVWDHDMHLYEVFEPLSGSPFKKLKEGVQMAVAVCRSTRVRGNARKPIEDVGVKPKYVFRRRKDDVRQSPRDRLLLRRVCLDVLAKQARGLLV